jgi:hypothetical protein
MPRENVRLQYLQYPLRITNENHAEVSGELPQPQGDEAACDRC